MQERENINFTRSQAVDVIECLIQFKIKTRSAQKNWKRRGNQRQKMQLLSLGRFHLYLVATETQNTNMT